MKKFVAPDGSIISMPEGRVIAYGLSPNEIPFIEKCLPSKDYELYVPDDVRDILAVSCFALIVEAARSRRSTTDGFAEQNGRDAEQSGLTLLITLRFFYNDKGHREMD